MLPLATPNGRGARARQAVKNAAVGKGLVFRRTEDGEEKGGRIGVPGAFGEMTDRRGLLGAK